MTGTALLKRSTEKFAEAGGFAIADPADKAPIKLGAVPKMALVDQVTQPPATPTPEPPDAGGPVPAGSPVPAGWKALLNVNRLEGNQGATIRFSSRSDGAKGDGPLRFSLVALSKAASGLSGNPGDWLDAASVLKRDAVRVRNSSSLGRHASVLLTLADALTFTLPSDPTLRPGATDALQRGLSVLTEPFISTETEKGLMIDLLSRGWNLAPASEGKPPAD
jgi:hypothetical protein